jgi:thiol-disulfide isomerase/thioredoxin
MPIISSTDQDLRNFLFEKPFVIVKFHTGDNCPTCEKLLKAFERLSDNYLNITFVLMNSDDNPTARQLIKKNKKPFFAVYKSGLLTECGLVDTEEELTKMLNRIPNIKLEL